MAHPNDVNVLFGTTFASQYKPKDPERFIEAGFNPDSAYNSMVPGSDSINPMKMGRDYSNSKFGMFGNQATNPTPQMSTDNFVIPGVGQSPALGTNPSNDAYQKLMNQNYGYGKEFSSAMPEGVYDSGANWLSDQAKEAITKGAITGAQGMAPGLANVVGRGVTGSRLGGNLAETGTATGIAAMQGFTNPAADLMALMSAIKTIIGVF